MLAALIFAVVGTGVVRAAGRCCSASRRVTSVVLVVTVVVDELPCPTSAPRTGKLHTPVTLYSAWGPVFRVDVVQLTADTSNYLLVHDGTFGSGIRRFDGNPASLTGTTRRTPVRSRSTSSASRPHAS